MMVVMVVMVLGKKQDSGTGKLALSLQEENFWVVQEMADKRPRCCPRVTMTFGRGVSNVVSLQ